MIDFVGDEILGFLKNHKSDVGNSKVLIKGFAFKGQPVTSDTRGSSTIKLVQKLQKEGIKNIYGYDPAVKRSDITDHGVKHVSDLNGGFSGADAVVVMNNNPAFKDIDIRAMLKSTSKPTFLFDTWGLYKKEEVQKVKGIHYKRL